MSASRSQSPSRFTLSAMSTSIRPGNTVIHHSPENRYWLPVLITLSVNLLGDWLRDALNPRLR